MKPTFHAVAVAVTALFCAAAAVTAHADSAAKPRAKITMHEARTKALALVPGRIKSAELERERGGSGLRYSFDIRSRDGLREVGVDALTGKVLENRHESRKDEAKEARSEHEQRHEREREHPIERREHEHEHDGGGDDGSKREHEYQHEHEVDD